MAYTVSRVVIEVINHRHYQQNSSWSRSEPMPLFGVIAIACWQHYQLCKPLSLIWLLWDNLTSSALTATKKAHLVTMLHRAFSTEHSIKDMRCRTELLSKTRPYFGNKVRVAETFIAAKPNISGMWVKPLPSRNEKSAHILYTLLKEIAHALQFLQWFTRETIGTPASPPLLKTRGKRWLFFHVSIQPL